MLTQTPHPIALPSTMAHAEHHDATMAIQHDPNYKPYFSEAHLAHRGAFYSRCVLIVFGFITSLFASQKPKRS